MELTRAEFDDKIQETIDTVLVAMAEHAELDPEKFYSMACILENLAFFSPVIYGALQQPKNKN
jgi:hypothetical protein